MKLGKRLIERSLNVNVKLMAICLATMSVLLITNTCVVSNILPRSTAYLKNRPISFPKKVFSFLNSSCFNRIVI